MQRRRKGRIFGILAGIILSMCFPCQSLAISTSADSAILVDVDSGRVLYEQNADARMRIASTTKILTALVAIRTGGLDRIVTVSRAAAGTEGSSMYLKAGEKLTLETLLYGLLLCSGNDAAVAVAEAVSGSPEEFAVQMNQTAQTLGMTHSSFANPNGLDSENHYSTARDMALLARAAINDETLMRIASTRKVTVGGRTMHNHNKLLGYLETCTGLKTGYTRAAGRTLVSCAERNGQRLAVVTLRDGNDWADHQALYEYGFAAFPSKRAAFPGEILVQEKVGDQTVPLAALEGFSWPSTPGETLSFHREAQGALELPLWRGTPAGEAVFTVGGKEVGRVGLICGRDLPASAETS